MPDALTIHAVDPVAFTRALIRCPCVTPVDKVERCTATDVEALSRIYERLLDRYFDA